MKLLLIPVGLVVDLLIARAVANMVHNPVGGIIIFVPLLLWTFSVIPAWLERRAS